MYYKKYESERLYLSPMNVGDYELYTKWMNDEYISSALGNVRKNINELNEKEFIENSNKKGTYDFALVRKEDNKLLGNYGLKVVSEISNRYQFVCYIGEKSERGKGYGTEALMLITKFAFEILNAHTVFSGIYSFNEASLKSAEKAGYKVAGRYREAYYYNSTYHDIIFVEMTRTDYQNHKSLITNNRVGREI